MSERYNIYDDVSSDDDRAYKQIQPDTLIIGEDKPKRKIIKTESLDLLGRKKLKNEEPTQESEDLYQILPKPLFLKEPRKLIVQNQVDKFFNVKREAILYTKLSPKKLAVLKRYVYLSWVFYFMISCYSPFFKNIMCFFQIGGMIRSVYI